MGIPTDDSVVLSELVWDCVSVVASWVTASVVCGVVSGTVVWGVGMGSVSGAVVSPFKMGVFLLLAVSLFFCVSLVVAFLVASVFAVVF